MLWNMSNWSRSHFRRKKVVGVELINEAVVNARQNVILNESKLAGKQIEFHYGKAEEILPKIVSE